MSKITQITPEHPDYPKRLEVKKLPDLFAVGNLSLLNKPGIAIVGSRKASAENLQLSEQLAARLAERGWVIVSGLALGVDTAAHKGALSVGGATTAVIGAGLKHITPKSNIPLAKQIVQQGGLMLSDQAPDTELRNYMLVKRNHTVASLSDSVIVIESKAKGGTMHTAHFALQLKRQIFCPTSCGQGGELLLASDRQTLSEYPAFARAKWDSFQAPYAQSFESIDQIVERIGDAS